MATEDYLFPVWNVSREDKVVDDELPSKSAELAVMIILSIFSVVGTLGNGLVLYVFTRAAIKLTSTIFILALAGTDFLTCILIIPFTVVAISVKYYLKYDIACKTYQFLITCNVPLSAFIMVAIAIDRYICICHPFVHIMTVKRAKFFVGILAGFAVILGLITALGFSVYTVTTTTFTTTFNSTAPYQDTSFVSTRNDSILNNVTYQTNVLEYVNGTYTQTNISFNGVCQLSSTLFSYDFINIYQKIYSSFYLISLLIVLILYGLIYRSVTKQREKRRAQKMGYAKKVNTQSQTDESTMPLNNLKVNGSASARAKTEVAAEGTTITTTISTHLTPSQENGVSDSETHPINRTVSLRKQSPQNDQSKEKKDHNRLANIKTAIMLFIVTIVFIIAFLPAWLMALGVIKFNTVIFYMYFSYNVANPVIYAFMNQMFRENLCKIFNSFGIACNRR